MKRSDIIDEIYGKSISFDRFLTACMVTDFPKYFELNKVFDELTNVLLNNYPTINYHNRTNANKYV